MDTEHTYHYHVMRRAIEMIDAQDGMMKRSQEAQTKALEAQKKALEEASKNVQPPALPK